MNKRTYFAIAALGVLSAVLRNELLFLMTIILGLVALASYGWTRYCLAAVSYRRRLGMTRFYVGEETELQVEIDNAKPLPLPWLRIDDDIPAGVNLTSLQVEEREPERRQLVNVLGLRWYERVIRRYRVQGTRRGAWTFGPAHVRSGDIFGFSIRRTTFDETDTVLVYPRVVPLARLGLPARHPLGDFRMNRRVIEDPLRMMSVRPYTQGDNFRHIHWKATAQRQALQTKVFEPSASRPVTIFLNINTTELFVYGYDPELREFAISAAASLAQHLWTEGWAVGLCANATISGTSHHVHVRSASHRTQLEQMLTALARIDEGWGRWTLEQLLTLEAPRLPYGATVVVVTAVLTETLVQTIRDLQRREFGVVLITLGTAQPDSPIPNLQSHYIGSHEEWHELSALELA